MKKLILLLILISCITLVACKKDDDEVPNVYVDIRVYTTDANFINLNAVGGWVYITGGSKGILVYRKSNSEFMAYDRHCTYQVEDGCRVDVDSSNIIAKDVACCSSKFVITDGSVTQGPANTSLKSYQTNFDGSVLHIYN